MKTAFHTDEHTNYYLPHSTTNMQMFFVGETIEITVHDAF